MEGKGMKKKGNMDLDKLNQSLLNCNQKTIKNIDTLTRDSAMNKSEKKLHKMVLCQDLVQVKIRNFSLF